MVIKHEKKTFTIQPNEDKSEFFLFITVKGYNGEIFIVTANKGDKVVRIFDLQGEEQGRFRGGKKIMALHPVETTIADTEVRGIIWADKFGEVRFYNLTQLGKEKTEEEEKKETTAADQEKEEGGKLLFGHQEIISHLVLNPSKTFILTVDVARKIKVTHFPNVVDMHSMNFNHTKEITNAFFVSDGVFVTYSKEDSHLSVFSIEKDNTSLLFEIKPFRDLDSISSIGDFSLSQLSGSRFAAVSSQKVVIMKVEGSELVTVETKDRNGEISTVEEAISDS